MGCAVSVHVTPELITKLQMVVGEDTIYHLLHFLSEVYTPEGLLYGHHK